MKAEKEYAFYKGEDILCIGTVNEIAAKFNILPQTVKFYGSNVYKRRIKKKKLKRKKTRNVRILVSLD